MTLFSDESRLHNQKGKFGQTVAKKEAAPVNTISFAFAPNSIKKEITYETHIFNFCTGGIHMVDSGFIPA